MLKRKAKVYFRLIKFKIALLLFVEKLITNKQGFPQILMGQLNQIPIYEAHTEDKIEIEKLVDIIIHLHKELQSAKIPSKTGQLQTRIDHTDNRINQLVYKMYGLTEEEIAMVEGENN